MKTQLKMLNSLLIAAIITSSGCGNGTNSATETKDSIVAKTDTAISETKRAVENAVAKAENAIDGNVDSNFVVKAATTNAAELKILQAGIDKCTDKELKAGLRKMQADHKKLGARVAAWSGKVGYALPDGDNGKADDELATLNNKSKGRDFDKELVDHLVSAHKDCIDMFEKGQKNVKDQELKDMITAALPTLNSHLDAMKQMQDKISKK